VNWRLTSHGPDVERSASANVASVPAEPRGTRRVSLWDSDRTVPVFERRALATGQTLDGPALIEERETTIVIPPRWRAVVDPTACIIATPTEA
jgi:N-methylhydantoinase A